MTIKYLLTKDNLLAFHRFQHEHSRIIRRVVKRYQWMPPILFAIIGVIGMWTSDVPLPYVIILIFAGFWPFVFPALHRFIYLKAASRMMKRGGGKLAEAVEVSIDDAGLEIRSAGEESSAGWERVRRIESVAHHTFVYFSAVSALIIPEESVIEGDYTSFVASLRQHFAGAGG